MGNKTKLITPFLTLLAGAIASIIMYVRGFDLTRMLWGLLAVLVVFYIIGDIVRYIYASIRPRIIPVAEIDRLLTEAKQKGDLTGNVVAFADGGDAEAQGSMDAGGFMAENAEGYSDEELGEYDAEDTAAAMEGYDDGFSGGDY